MTKIFIIEPMTGEHLTAKEWKERAEDPKTAIEIVIVPDDGSHPFLITKKTVCEAPWKEAREAVQKFKVECKGEVVHEGFDLPTRKQFIDIRDARSCGLEQVLELIGGDQLLKDFRSGEWFWTSEVWIPAGTSAEDYTHLALPLLLYDFREANV